MRGKFPTRPGTARYPLRDISRVDSIDVHHTAGPTSQTVEQVAAYQTGPGSHLAFPEVAYHLIVPSDGRPRWCHSLNVRTWHNGAPGQNERAIGICYTGNNNPTAAQLRGIRQAIQWCQAQRGRSLTVRGHRDTHSTACPGESWPAWRREVLP